MKKVKYLFGLLILGFCLLINQSFGIDVEVVSTQFSTGFTNADYTYSYSYLYRFDTLFDGGRGCSNSASNPGGCFGNSEYSNKQQIINQSCFWNRYESLVPAYNYGFANSIYSFETYTGRRAGGQGFTATANANCNQSSTPKVLFGTNNNLGKNVLYLDCLDGSLNCAGVSPKYFVGGGSYFTGISYLQLELPDIGNSFRVFFHSTGGVNNISNGNLISPTDWPVGFAWEYFTNRQTRTNFGYIVDNNGRKGKHFGSMGMGYSFVYNKDLALSGQKISWNTLGFTTVSDDILINLRAFGGLDLINFEGTKSFYTDGILIFRKSQYTTNGNDGVIVVSKNPNNTKQLLYQEFSCQTNNFQCLARGQSTGSDGVLTNYCPSYIIDNQSSSYNPCIVLGQGLLTYNGSTDILPFTSKTQLVNISSNDILSYLFNTSSSMLGGTYENGDNFCIGDNPTGNGICFGKVSSPDSIKENYLNGDYENPYEYITTGQIDNGMYELCTTNEYFASVNYELCHGLNPSDSLVISGADYIITYLDCSGEIIQKVIPRPDYEAGFYVNDLGVSCYVCNSSHSCSVYNTGSSYFNSGSLDIGYYDFNNTGLFFKCPYPYNSVFGTWQYDFSIGGFDILGPINCMIAGFQHGKSFDMFDNVGLFGFGPLMDGDTQQHKILFRFFDMLLILGFVLFFSLIYKRFK